MCRPFTFPASPGPGQGGPGPGLTPQVMRRLRDSPSALPRRTASRPQTRQLSQLVQRVHCVGKTATIPRNRHPRRGFPNTAHTPSWYEQNSSGLRRNPPARRLAPPAARLACPCGARTSRQPRQRHRQPRPSRRRSGLRRKAIKDHRYTPPNHKELYAVPGGSRVWAQCRLRRRVPALASAPLRVAPARAHPPAHRACTAAGTPPAAYRRATPARLTACPRHPGTLPPPHGAAHGLAAPGGAAFRPFPRAALRARADEPGPRAAGHIRERRSTPQHSDRPGIPSASQGVSFHGVARPSRVCASLR